LIDKGLPHGGGGVYYQMQTKVDKEGVDFYCILRTSFMDDAPTAQKAVATVFKH